MSMSQFAVSSRGNPPYWLTFSHPKEAFDTDYLSRRSDSLRKNLVIDSIRLEAAADME